MTFSARCWKRRLVPLAIVTSLPSGCVTAGSERSVAAVCPPVVEYGTELQAAAAAEVEALPTGSAVDVLLSDYAVMRDQARACPLELKSALRSTTDSLSLKALARAARVRTYHEHGASSEVVWNGAARRRSGSTTMPSRCASRCSCPSAASRTCCLDMHRWLDAEVGRGNYAEHGAGAGLTRRDRLVLPQRRGGAGLRRAVPDARAC